MEQITYAIFSSPPKKRIFVRRHHAEPALLSCRVVTVVSSLPNPSLTLSSFLPGSYDQHFTAAQGEELPLASLPWWWHGGPPPPPPRRHLQLENLNCDPQGKISNTITNLYTYYTHSHIASQKQSFATLDCILPFTHL